MGKTEIIIGSGFLQSAQYFSKLYAIVISALCIMFLASIIVLTCIVEIV